MEVIDLFKAEPGMDNEQEITFYSEDGGDACRVALEEGGEYLLDLIQTDGGLLASSCGLVEEWNTVRAEVRAAVQDGCEVDKCEGACDEFQARIKDDSNYARVFDGEDEANPRF